MRRVAVIGYKQTKHEFPIEVSRERMIYTLVKSLYDEYSLKRDDIDTVVMASNDFYDGRTISEVFTVEPSSSVFKDETKVEGDGAFAFLYGVMRIASGAYDSALIVAHSKGSEYEQYYAQRFFLNPLFERQYQYINELSLAALQANSYMNKYGIKEEDIAQVSVKNLKNAIKNPAAVRKGDYTVNDILNSKILYSPLRELTIYPQTDGAAAVVLMSEEKAKKFTDNPIWFLGGGFCQDTYYFGERELHKLESCKKAAKSAYFSSRIDNPKNIEILEVSELFAHQELMLYEALGLCEEGKGIKLLERENLPINLSGGALSAHPGCATGLVRIAECCAQLRGEASNQIDSPKTALAHGQFGPLAQSNIVIILGTEKGAAWKGKRIVPEKRGKRKKKEVKN